MISFAHQRSLPWPLSGLTLAGVVWLVLILFPLPAAATDYPWVYLTAENDSRDDGMRAYDEADSRHVVGLINNSEPLFRHHLAWRKSSVRNLLSMDAPFCEMHFDAVRPFSFTAEEKSILTEYFKRGGFILFVIDTYPYAQDEFWKIDEWPLIDFIARDLPSSDPDFTSGKATDDFPIFSMHYHTQTADAIRHELTGNPNTPNRTLLYYQKRLCAFVMGRYGYLEDDVWIPAPRPFAEDFSMDPKSYQLIVNIYVYSIVR